MGLDVGLVRMRFGDCRPQEVNARYMRKEQYDTLVENIRRDGCLTSVPLLYQPDPGKPAEIISGHHRIQAGIEVFGADGEFDAMVVRDDQSRQEIIARQISHNAIAGEDDYATLKQLYDQLDDVDWRIYSGLDDKTLELMESVELSSLSEANLEFQMVQIAFLPHEKEAAETALEEAKKIGAGADEQWLAGLAQYEDTLRAIETARGAYSIGNIATALGIVIEVFERHLEDLQDGWFDPVEGAAKTTKFVPVETLVGGRQVPADAAAVVAQAVTKMRREEGSQDLPAWRALELLAADFLAN